MADQKEMLRLSSASVSAVPLGELIMFCTVKAEDCCDKMC
jgi:hypothetical protein